MINLNGCVVHNQIRHHPPAEDQACPARDIALLPASLGGLGLSQATRTAPAAYWAWADALTMLREWCPAFTDWAVHSLADAHGPACLRTASAVHGKAGRTCLTGSSWRRIGEWRHGWQHCDVLGTFSSATTCCCLRTPLLGFRPSPAHTPHSSTPSGSRCVAYSGSHSRPLPLREHAGAPRNLGVATALIRLETVYTHPRAPGLATWLGEPSWLSERGARLPAKRLPAKLLDQKHTWCRQHHRTWHRA